MIPRYTVVGVVYCNTVYTIVVVVVQYISVTIHLRTKVIGVYQVTWAISKRNVPILKYFTHPDITHASNLCSRKSNLCLSIHVSWTKSSPISTYRTIVATSRKVIIWIWSTLWCPLKFPTCFKLTRVM